ncbi:MAG: hypothetical protein NZM94_01420, partial [Roseiflexus sp.]|nr:hypothetical protein [Roseiflexus sp.]
VIASIVVSAMVSPCFCVATLDCNVATGHFVEPLRCDGSAIINPLRHTIGHATNTLGHATGVPLPCLPPAVPGRATAAGHATGVPLPCLPPVVPGRAIGAGHAADTPGRAAVAGRATDTAGRATGAGHVTDTPGHATGVPLPCLPPTAHGRAADTAGHVTDTPGRAAVAGHASGVPLPCLPPTAHGRATGVPLPANLLRQTFNVSRSTMLRDVAVQRLYRLSPHQPQLVVQAVEIE